MRPGVFSKWNDKIRPGDRGKLVLGILSFINYNGQEYK